LLGCPDYPRMSDQREFRRIQRQACTFYATTYESDCEGNEVVTNKTRAN
jgi:hypothetical protein